MGSEERRVTVVPKIPAQSHEARPSHDIRTIGADSVAVQDSSADGEILAQRTNGYGWMDVICSSGF